MEAARFGKVWEAVAFAKNLVGIGSPENRARNLLGKVLLVVLVANWVHFVVICCYSSVKTMDENATQAVVFGFEGVVGFLVYLFKFFLLRYGPLYDDCLEWCESLHRRTFELQNTRIQRIFSECREFSETWFHRIVARMPLIVFTTAATEVLVVSLILRKVSPVAPLKVLWSDEDSSWNLFVVTVNQLLMLLDVRQCECLIFGVILVTIEHFLALIESLKVVLRSLELPISDRDFGRAVRMITEMHVELMEQESNLADLTSTTTMIFEFVANGGFLLSLTVLFFDLSQFWLAVIAADSACPFIFLCLLNERLAQASESLRDALFELNWYELKPRQQKMLQVIMVMSDRPILLEGPFHQLSYEALTDFFNRLYSYFLAIKDFMPA